MPAPGQSASGGPVGAAGGKPLSVGTGTGGRRRAMSKRGRGARKGGAALPATTDAAPANSAGAAPALAPMGGRRVRKTARKMGRRRGGADAPAPAPAAAAVAADGAADVADVAAAGMTGAARIKMKKAVKKMKKAGAEMAEVAVMPGATMDGAGSESDEEMAMAAPMGGRKARSKKGMLGRLSRYF